MLGGAGLGLGAPRVPCSKHVGPGMCMRDKRLVRNPEGISFSRADESWPKSPLPTPGALLPCFPPVSGSPRVPESLFPAPSCGRWAGGSLGGPEHPTIFTAQPRAGPWGFSLPPREDCAPKGQTEHSQPWTRSSPPHPPAFLPAPTLRGWVGMKA